MWIGFVYPLGEGYIITLVKDSELLSKILVDIATLFPSEHFSFTFYGTLYRIFIYILWHFIQDFDIHFMALYTGFLYTFYGTLYRIFIYILWHFIQDFYIHFMALYTGFLYTFYGTLYRIFPKSQFCNARASRNFFRCH